MLIQDLSKELDAQAMTSVRGGDNGNSVVNTIGQSLNISSPVAVLAGGPVNTSVHVNGTQTATIDNEQFAGESLFALLPSFPL